MPDERPNYALMDGRPSSPYLNQNKGFIYLTIGVASDAFAFRRSKKLVLLYLATGVFVFFLFCLLAHFKQLAGLNTSLTYDVGGLTVNMLETFSSRSLGALLLWVRLLVVVWRRPREAGVLKCPMKRTLVSRRALEELRARGQPPLIYPEGVVIDKAGHYVRNAVPMPPQQQSSP